MATMSLSALCVATLLLALGPAGAQTYTWSNVRVGGGGYTTGMIVHPKNNNVVYVRTDVGGAYRWDSANSTWTNLTDKLLTSDPASGEYRCVESIAVDPSDTSANTLYVALGGYGSDTNGRVYRSNNRGDSWQPVATLGAYVNGNLDGRWAGERLQVDPNNAQVVYFGTRKHGLWRSTNGGTSFTRISAFGPVGGGNSSETWKRYGVNWVAIEKNGGTTTSGGVSVSARVFAGVYGGDSPDGGVWASTDGGTSWSKLSGSPLDRPWRGQVAADGALWVTSEGGVFRKLSGFNSFANVTPSSDPGAYVGLALDPANGARVAVSRFWSNFWTPVYRTDTTGSSWTSVTNGASFNYGSNAQPNPHAAVCALAFAPSLAGRLWYGDWYSPWKTENVLATNVGFTAFNQGYELTDALVLTSLPAPSAAPLISGTADVSGFRHTSLTTNPSKLSSAGYNGTSVDFCEADTNLVARAGNDGWNGPSFGMTSSDNGQSFGISWPTSVTNGYSNVQVAVSSTKQGNGWPVLVLLGRTYDGANNVWRTRVPLRSLDGGASWSAVSGVPETTGDYWGQFDPRRELASDRASGSTFYYFANNSGQGVLYRSGQAGARLRL
jgi:hypothetical protein